jgi:hypothetical protein
VAHIGEERTLGPVGGLGLVTCLCTSSRVR